MSHSAFTGISRHHLGRLVAELAGPWQAGRESDLRRRRGRERRRAAAAAYVAAAYDVVRNWVIMDEAG